MGNVWRGSTSPPPFDDVIGVTIPNDDVKVETIRLRFSENRFPYVLSKPIHHSQVQVQGEPDTIEIKVRPTRELNQIIFSFIPDVEVISPEGYHPLEAHKVNKDIQNQVGSCLLLPMF